MSYSIFYRAMFLKTRDEKYIPIIEAGDNNVWEADCRRRARDWDALRWLHESEEQRKRYALAEKEILDAAQKVVDDTVSEYEGKTPPFGGEPHTRQQILADFSYFRAITIYGHRTSTATQFLNFVRSGIRNAVTFDDLQREHCPVMVSWWKEGKYHEETAADENELETVWNRCLSEGFTPYLGYGAGAESLWREVKSRTRREKARRQSAGNHGQFIISFKHLGCETFVYKLTSRRVLMTRNREFAKKYASSSSAGNACRRLSPARFENISDVKIQKISA